MRKLGEDLYLKAIARSIHFDRYLFLCEKMLKWKYITKEARERTIQFMKHILSYKIDVEKKYNYIVGSSNKSNNKKNNEDDDDLDDIYGVGSVVDEGVADL